MELIIFVGVVAICFFYVGRTGRKAELSRRKRVIEEKFGSSEIEKKELPKHIDSYCKNYGEECVDDVTWNDLSFNEVFKRINRCDSSAGEEILYSKLRGPKLKQEEMELLEKRIQFAEENEEERKKIELTLAELGKGEASYLIPSYLDGISEYHLEHLWTYRLQQVLLAVAFVLMLIFHNTNMTSLFIFVVIINLITYMTTKSKYELEIDMLGNVVSLFLVGEKFSKSYEKEGICDGLGKNVEIFQKIGRLVITLQSQRNARYSGDVIGMMTDYLLGITMWQVFAYDKVIRQLECHIKEYIEVYRMLGEIDMAISIASFRKSLPFYEKPEFTEKRMISIEDLYHPLLSNPVCNSLNLEKNCIITGSNASGKSTFIKAVAVNVILAQTIHTVTARKMILPPARMITSMAVADDIMSGESYFMKEIKYLKRILETISEEEMTICAIDEILRGTNTEERIAASKAILDELSKKNCIAFVASHDKELTDGWNKKYVNYHFSEEFGEEDILFDYKIKEGPANTKNAIRLLEYVKFPAEVIAEAKRRVAQGN